MNAREAVRRTAIWGTVAAYYPVAVWMAVLSLGGGPAGTNGPGSSAAFNAAALVGITAFALFPLVGALILTSRPRNGVGRALLAESIACVLLATVTAAAPAMPAWFEAVAGALTVPFWASFTMIPLIFPSGRIETRLGRWVAWSTLATSVVFTFLSAVAPGPLEYSGRDDPLAIPALAALTSYRILNVIQVVLILGVLIDFVLRWSRADRVARLQFRWLLTAICIILPVIVAVGVTISVTGGTVDVPTSAALSALLNLIPIAIYIAISRNGLYEINRVISRTVSYLAVTAVIVGVYVAVVLGIGALLPNASSVAVAIATLAAAALFLPILRWMQRRIDRAFDRERYDAQAVVDAFGERLRSGTDPQTAPGDLVAAMEQTLQPATAGIWTRPVPR